MLKVVHARLDELVLNDKNPRALRPEREGPFLRSLAGQTQLIEARPVIAHRRTKKVIAGNQRVWGGRKLGWETIPTVFVELDEVQEALWMFLDNRGFGEDDEDLAAELLAELKEQGVDLDLTGFERAETDALLRKLLQRDNDPDQVVAPSSVGEPESRFGEVYELGAHRLMCGDATNPEHVAKLLADAKPKVMTSDSPYGVNLDNGWRDEAGLRGKGPRLAEHAATTLASDSRADWSDAYELVPSLEVAYVWHASRFACEVEAGLNRVGFHVRQQIIWDKGLFALSRQHYHWQHEPCLYAIRAGTTPAWHGRRNQSTVWSVPSPKMVAARGRADGDGKVDHPTQKPVALYTRPIENHLEADGVLYDPFAGSGTALIAAEMTGRVCNAMELDPRCCDLIRARYEEFTRVG